MHLPPLYKHRRLLLRQDYFPFLLTPFPQQTPSRAGETPDHASTRPLLLFRLHDLRQRRFAIPSATDEILHEDIPVQNIHHFPAPQKCEAPAFRPNKQNSFL